MFSKVFSVLSAASHGGLRPIQSVGGLSGSPREQECFMLRNRLLCSRGSSLAVAALAITALMGQSAHAALLAYEPFNYTVGTNLANQTVTGTGFTGTWSPWSSGNGDKISANSLSEGGLATSYNSLAVTGYPPIVATLASPISAPTATTPVWASFLYNPGGSTYYGGFTLNINDANNRGLAFGVNDNPSTHLQQFTILNSAPLSAVASAAPVAKTTYLLVMEDVATSGGGTINLYVNPTVGAANAPATPDATFNYTLAEGNITSVTLYGLTSNPVTIDEIRLGTTYADVTPAASVPEPASLGLLGAGALGLMLMGRKCQIAGAGTVGL